MWLKRSRPLLRLAILGVPFLFAGTVDWPGAWLFATVIAATILLNLAVMRRWNPSLLRARLESHAGTKTFDKVFGAVAALSIGAMLAVAGLDHRFGWSRLTSATIYMGIALHFAGMIPITWTMAVNPFLETTVRIQSDRGHFAVRSGPYCVVRHPMYAGLLTALSGWPLIFGSVWSYLPGAILAVALVIRTVFEDRTLRSELDGYRDYTNRTPFRLVPMVW